MMDHLGYQVSREKWAQEGFQVLEDLQDYLGHQEFLELKEVLDRKEMKGRSGHLDPLVFLVIKVQ